MYRFTSTNSDVAHPSTLEYLQKENKSDPYFDFYHRKLLLLVLYIYLETRSKCVALVGLELTIQLRLVLNSRSSACLCLLIHTTFQNIYSGRKASAHGEQRTACAIRSPSHQTGCQVSVTFTQMP